MRTNYWASGFLASAALVGLASSALATTTRAMAGAGCLGANGGYTTHGAYSQGAAVNVDVSCPFQDDSYMWHSNVASIYVDTWVAAGQTVYATACVLNGGWGGELDYICGTTFTYYNSASTGVWANPDPSNTAWYNNPGVGWYPYVDVSLPGTNGSPASYINGLVFGSF